VKRKRENEREEEYFLQILSEYARFAERIVTQLCKEELHYLTRYHGESPLSRKEKNSKERPSLTRRIISWD
jgi:hypothetical protein